SGFSRVRTLFSVVRDEDYDDGAAGRQKHAHLPPFLPLLSRPLPTSISLPEALQQQQQQQGKKNQVDVSSGPSSLQAMPGRAVSVRGGGSSMNPQPSQRVGRPSRRRR
ncbi:unnamed protein product, partial [Laminaria digitata]